MNETEKIIDLKIRLLTYYYGKYVESGKWSFLEKVEWVANTNEYMKLYEYGWKL